MASELRYSTTAVRQLRKLDRQVARRILDYMDEVASLEDPRSRGKALVGERAGIWRYRVGDHRVLCDLSGLPVVVAIEIGRRGAVYR